jgi:hypothetical protein
MQQDLTPQQYFAAFAKKDIRWVVGYQDTAQDGDTTCMANLQGGTARRDRNLSWWRYLNTLAGTNQDLTGFPGALPGLVPWSNLTGGTLNHTLTVVYTADHSAAEVFGSPEGQSALLDAPQNVLQGWRPAGWKNVTAATVAGSNSTNSSAASSNSSASTSSATLSQAASSIRTAVSFSIVLAASAAFLFAF